MNTQTHRLIFNKSRGCMVAVGENARSGGGGCSGARRCKRRCSFITSPVISAVQSVQQQAQAASNTGSERMQALAAANAAMQVKQGADAVQKAAAQGDATGGAGISVSVGSSSSQSQSQSSADNAKGSNVSAGGNVSITATGAGKDSDINVRGSDITAGGQTLLKADDQVNLLAGECNSRPIKSDKKYTGGMERCCNSFGCTASSGSIFFPRGLESNWDSSQRRAMNMLRIVFGLLTSVMLLTACGIGGVWLEPSNRPRGPEYPYGARWVKEGMTRESRKVDWAACGGGENLSDGFRKWIQPEPWEIFWPMKDAHSKQLWACMKSRDYDYRNPQRPSLPDECDARICLYP